MKKELLKWAVTFALIGSTVGLIVLFVTRPIIFVFVAIVFFVCLIRHTIVEELFNANF